MLIIADHRLPRQAQQKLAAFGDFYPFKGNAAYDAIRSHPDVYLCKLPDRSLIVAPNAPQSLFQKLNEHQIPWKTGKKAVGTSFPDTALYNAVMTENIRVFHEKITDQSIRDVKSGVQKVTAKQAYIRCNLLMLNDKSAICSDGGIAQKLQEAEINVLQINPRGIQLPGFDYGFIGGCLGLSENRVFVSGSLDFHPQGKQMEAFIQESGFQIVELFKGSLLDVGGLFFLKQKKGSAFGNFPQNAEFVQGS